MATNPLKRHIPKPDGPVIQWLLVSDPAIRWQVMRDLTGAPVGEVAAERARVATEGWGVRAGGSRSAPYEFRTVIRHEIKTINKIRADIANCVCSDPL